MEDKTWNLQTNQQYTKYLKLGPPLLTAPLKWYTLIHQYL